MCIYDEVFSGILLVFNFSTGRNPAKKQKRFEDGRFCRKEPG